MPLGIGKKLSLFFKARQQTVEVLKDNLFPLVLMLTMSVFGTLFSLFAAWAFLIAEELEPRLLVRIIDSILFSVFFLFFLLISVKFATLVYAVMRRRKRP